MDSQPQQPPPPSSSPPPRNGRPFIDVTPEPVEEDHFESGEYRRPLDRVLRRRRGIFFLFLFAFTTVAALWLLTQPKVYQASAAILLTRVGSTARPVAESEIASEIELIRAGISSLGRKTAGGVSESVQAAEARQSELSRHIDIRQRGKSQIVEVAVTDASAKEATDRANELTRIYLEQRHRLLTQPLHLVAVDAEASVLGAQADEAAKELAQFDARTKGASLTGSSQVKSERLASLEDRVSEMRASVRGQEEVVRAMRQSPRAAETDAGILHGEVQLAGMRAKLRELESERGRLERLETQAGTLAAKREELDRKARLAMERAEAIDSRLQQSRIEGMSLQARPVSQAEVKMVRTLEFTWWFILGLAGAIVTASWIVASASDLFDRPVYDDEDLERESGVPTYRTASN